MIVLYAKSDIWWIQPNRRHPYTPIRPDGTWSADIHLGMEYAALLVDPDFQPDANLMELPHLARGISAIISVKGKPSVNPRPPVSEPPYVRFSGYDWTMRTDRSDRGGILRPYSADNVWVDAQGSLHLKVTREANRWVCSELSMVRSLGYGTYNFEVRDVGQFEPALMLDLFTWTNINSEEEHHEMNVTIGRRGEPGSKNAEYIVQPYYVPANVSRFSVPAGRLTYSFDWQPDSITFQTWKGHVDTSDVPRIFDHVFVSGIPPAGGETAHMNFCAFGYGKVTLQHEAEVIVDRFQYLP
jgi:hypothetical protein